jgi:hypothetical protein
MAHTIVTQKIKSFSTQEHSIYKVLAAQSSGTSDELSAESLSIASIAAKINNPGTAGVVVLEGSPISGDAATWITLATLTFTAGGKWLGADTSGGTYACRFLRARISTQISNGTVDVYIGLMS